jgi:hypothetical protein
MAFCDVIIVIVIILNVIRQSTLMLNVIQQSVIMLNVILRSHYAECHFVVQCNTMLNVILHSIVIQNATIPNVTAPKQILLKNDVFEVKNYRRNADAVVRRQQF